MAAVERLSITLPAEMAQKIRRKVSAGEYASDSDVIREAMRALEAEEQLRRDRLATVRTMIATADADPRPSISEDEVDRHFVERGRISGAKLGGRA